MSNSRNALAVSVSGPSWKFITTNLEFVSQAGIDACEKGSTTNSVNGLDAVDIFPLFGPFLVVRSGALESSGFAFMSIGCRDSQEIEGEREAYKVVIIG